MTNQVDQPTLASVTGGVSGGGGAAGQILIATTHPIEALRHNISDDELVRVSEANNSTINQAFWTCIGGVIGSAPAAWRAISQVGAENQALSLDSYELFDVVIFCVVLAVAGTLFFVNRKNNNEQKLLISEIRSRPKRY